MKPKIYAEINLTFDIDYDVNLISKKTGIIPSECSCRCNNRISPLTNKKIKGYWTVKRKTYRAHDINLALENLIAKVRNALPIFKKICENNDGVVVFCIVLNFKPGELPAVYFQRDFLEIVHELNATIQFDMYTI